MMTKRPLLWTWSVAIALLAPVAGAQQASPQAAAQESDALTDKARELFEDGVKSAKAGKWSDAHASFLAAWGIKPHYQIASNLGVASLKVGRPRDAAQYLSLYLREAPATKVQERERAEASLKEARAQVTAITVQVTPEGAEVTVDGTTVGQAPLVDPVFLDPGKHDVGVKLEGYVPEARVIEATAGGTEMIRLQLKRRPALSVAVRPEPLAPAAPSDSGSGARTAVIVGGGVVAGAGVAAGVVLTVLANSRASEAEKLRKTLFKEKDSLSSCLGVFEGNCRKLKDTVNSNVDLSNAAFWSFVAAGAVGAGTLVYALVTSKPAEPAPSFRVAPLLAPRAAGLSLSGQL
ncbi:hypothetical protein BE17_07805 [Sorangium cellulosum]|uniref:PEGA domain-containing protein n=1 Tax=Sorangium cellulosum TaxID=56 RepID=A0A150R6X5_SORCE|nr:hypothetical protein BE17_07805 [Sorangium cellulosum]